MNEIPPPHLDLVELEVACDRIDRALGDVCAFGPAIAAIGVNRHGIGHDHPGARLIVVDLVSAGAEIDRIHGRTAARHVRQIGADIAQGLDLQAENLAVVAERDLDIFRMRAAMAGRLMAFGAALPPLDRYAKFAREIGAEQVLRIEMHLGAEAASDIRRDHPQLMLGNADRLGDPAAVHVGHLAADINRQGAVRLRRGNDRARFHAGRDQAVVDDAQADDLIGLARGVLVVAAAAPCRSW